MPRDGDVEAAERAHERACWIAANPEDAPTRPETEEPDEGPDEEAADRAQAAWEAWRFGDAEDGVRPL